MFFKFINGAANDSLEFDKKGWIFLIEKSKCDRVN